MAIKKDVIRVEGLDNMEEIWKDIKNYEGLYIVSNLGNIKSFVRYKDGKILKPQKNKKGYLQILLYKNGKPSTKKVHRLVAETFLDNFYDKPQVNHIDGNKENNNVANLEMVTNSENQIHAYKNNLEKPKFKRKIKQYDKMGNYIQTYEYAINAKNKTGIDESSIIKCCRGKRKTAGNYIWKYAD